MRGMRLLVVALAASTLSACVVAPYPRRVIYAEPVPAQLVEAPVIVDVAPPPPYVDVVPAPPFAGALWIGGYWGWAGGRHQWMAGHYERPRPGYFWRPHAWMQQGGRWHLHPGGWARG